MADWPSPHHHELHPLPRIEDLPAVWEGYDRERVRAAFDAFYRHIAQLDATLRTLESVEVFRGQAGDLRAELRSLRAAGWAPYPRGYTLTPERSMLGSVPEAVPRIALEVVFLIVVAAVVAVAKFSALEIVAVMAGAVVITFLVELIAARDRRSGTPIPAAAPAARAPVAAAPAPPPAVAGREKVQTPTDELPAESAPADDVGGWAAFAEPAGAQPLNVMGAIVADEEQHVEADREQPAEEAAELQRAQAEPEPAAEAEPEPAGDLAEDETGTIPRQRRFGRRKHEDRPHEPEPAPKHVRVLPTPESGVAEADLPPWERGFDDTEERR